MVESIYHVNNINIIVSKERNIDMKQGKTFLYVAGVSLICAVALMTYQVSNYKEQSSHQKITSIETSQSREIPSDPKKEVPGIDKATDDGFLLTDESQIEEKTDLGIIVNHGDHKHFFFYSDLKNTKWSYLIPENYQEKTHSSQPNRNERPSGSKQTEDEYIFDPKDIVAEDANGYTVRHGDHYHYILKSSLGGTTHRQLTSGSRQSSTLPIVHQQEGIPGIDFQTSDGFLFDGQNISGVTETGILVRHGKHLHLIHFETLKKSKWSYLVNQYKPNVESDKKSQPEVENTEYQTKLDYLAKELNLEPSRLKKVIVDGQIGLEYPHGDHTHIVLLKEIDTRKPFESPEDRILKQKDGETLEQRKERLIKQYMERFKVKREDITIDGNYMSVRHGDHAHVYKIDPSLPDDPERDVKTETVNLAIEKQSVYGPFYTEGSTENLTRNGVHQKYHPEGLQDIKNFILVTFSTNSDFGDFVVNGKKTKRVYYLVRKDLNWEDLNITYPQTLQQKGRVFNGWNATLPKSGKMAREHQSFYADFDNVYHKPTKNIYTPSDDVSNIDLSDYVPVKYSAIANGRLKLNGEIRAGFIYFVKSDLTWKQAKEQGLIVPEPVPSKDYEFIEFRTVITGGEKDTDSVSATTSLAAFGTTAPRIGPYIAENTDNPTDINDPSRHPNYHWHDPKNYVALAFRVGEGGQLQTHLGTSKTVVYLVRKGLTLNQAGIFPPSLKSDKGYKRDYTKPIIPNVAWDTPILEDTVYDIHFDKVESDSKDGTAENGNTWLPGNPLPNTPDVSNGEENADSWLDDLLTPSSEVETVTEDTKATESSTVAPIDVPKNPSAGEEPSEDSIFP